jgi:hypothetical protein
MFFTCAKKLKSSCEMMNGIDHVVCIVGLAFVEHLNTFFSFEFLKKFIEIYIPDSMLISQLKFKVYIP